MESNGAETTCKHIINQYIMILTNLAPNSEPTTSNSLTLEPEQQRSTSLPPQVMIPHPFDFPLNPPDDLEHNGAGASDAGSSDPEVGKFSNPEPLQVRFGLY